MTKTGDTSGIPQWVAMDPYPRTRESDTLMHEFWVALDEGRLVTTRCCSCGHTAWPPRIVCPGCLSDSLAWAELPTSGTVAGCTSQGGGLPPGFTAPAIFALVDVGSVRIFTRIVDADPEAVDIGDTVTLTTIEVPPAPGDPDSRARHLPAFRPASAAPSTEPDA